MRLAWVTDPHLNFVSPARLEAFRDELDAAGCPILITGDIADGPHLAPTLRILETLAHPVYFVLGNHDYYHSSIVQVRAMVARMCRESERLRWLPRAGVVELTPGVALVGVDGWADARMGDWLNTRVRLSDFHLIEELTGLTHLQRVGRLGELGSREARMLEPLVDEAATRFRRVVIATHVPPFREAAWHRGRISEDDWLPYFTSQAVGEVILKAFEGGEAEATVYCGHTHGGGAARIRGNIEVHTGEAEYGHPRILKILEFPDDGGPDVRSES